MPVVQQRANEYSNTTARTKNGLVVGNSVTKQTSTSSIDSGASSSSSATASGNSSQRSAILSINEEIKLKFQTNSLFRKTRQHQQSDDNCSSVNDDDKLIKMANEKKLVKKGNHEGLLYDVDHLATFESSRGPISPEDGMRKLRAMERKQGLWPMKCQLMISSNHVIVFEKETNRAVEAIHVSKVCNPVSATSDNKKDTFNNVLLFTVLDDSSSSATMDNNKKSSSASSSSSAGGSIANSAQQTEMHIFQCVRANSNEIVDEIYQVVEQFKKQQRLEIERMQQQQLLQQQHPSSRQRHPDSMPPPPVPSSADPKMMMNQTMQSMNNSFHQPNGIKFPSHTQSLVEQRDAVDQQVQILNHCFDDIEQFVSRLQNSLQYLRELERRRTSKRHSPSSSSSKRESGMLAMRAQLPPPDQFVDIFQKFKLSFNLLARLKTHIVDPNAPDLIRFLFTPLALIVNSTRDRPELKGIVGSVWQPLLIADARELLLMCLGSKEQSLWRELGQAWNVTREEVYKRPDTYRSLLENLPPYVPAFYDDWSPSNNFNIHDLIDGGSGVNSTGPVISNEMMNRSTRDNNSSHRHHPSSSTRHSDLSGLASSAVDQVNQSFKNSTLQQQVLPINKSRNYPNGQPVAITGQQSSMHDEMAHQSMNASYHSSQQHRPSMLLNNSVMNRNGGGSGSNSSIPPPPPPMPHHQNHNNTTLNMSVNGYNPPKAANQSMMKSDMNGSMMNVSKMGAASIPEYDEMRAWAGKLLYNGALVYEITLGREGKNEKELSVRTGELIEVLDDKRNWWKVKSFYGRLGYVPSTIVRKYEPASSTVNPSQQHYNQHHHHQSNGGHHQMPEKNHIELYQSDDSDTTIINEDEPGGSPNTKPSQLNISSSALSLDRQIKPVRTSSVLLPADYLTRPLEQDTNESVRSEYSEPLPDYSKLEQHHSVTEPDVDYSMSVKSSTSTSTTNSTHKRQASVVNSSKQRSVSTSHSRRSSSSHKSRNSSRASSTLVVAVPSEQITTSSPMLVSSNENANQFQTQSGLNNKSLILGKKEEQNSRRASSSSREKSSKASSIHSSPAKSHRSSSSSSSKHSSPKYFDSNVYLYEYKSREASRQEEEQQQQSLLSSRRQSDPPVASSQSSRSKSTDRVTESGEYTVNDDEETSSSSTLSDSSSQSEDSESSDSRATSHRSNRSNRSRKPNSIPNLERIIGKTLLSKSSVEFKKNHFNFYPSYNAKPNRLRKKIPSYVLYPVVLPNSSKTTTRHHQFLTDAETSTHLNIESASIVSGLNSSSLSVVEVKQNTPFYIDKDSSPDEVKQFLVCHSFPRKIVRAFGGLNGQAIFALTEEQLIKYAGRKYGSVLNYYLTAQRIASKIINQEYNQSEELARTIKNDVQKTTL